jgi:predicted CXXCH cytochrome family protein
MARRGRSRDGAAFWLAALAVAATCTRPLALSGEERADSCVECHAELPDELGAPVAAMQDDVHAAHGVSCVDCHGGNANDPDPTAMDEEQGFRGKPERTEVPDFCARCHSDPAYMRRFNPSLPTNQRERYRTSVHGQRLAEDDEKVATCTDCHGSHGMLSGRQVGSPVYPANVPSTCGRCHSDPASMAEYGLAVRQEVDYRSSVHGRLLLQKRDLSAPTCSTCHDNHGAYPPGVTSIADVCGQCHVNNRDFFVASPHKRAFDDRGLAECVTCHGNHAIQEARDAMLGVDEGALCRRCHVPGSKGFLAAKSMRSAIVALQGAIEETDATLGRAERLGMEVSDARYEFAEAGQILIKARTAVHRFAAEPVVAVLTEGLDLCKKIKTVAHAAIDEAETRRRNLLFPVGIIAVLIVALALKIRQLERRAPADEPPPPGPPPL